MKKFPVCSNRGRDEKGCLPSTEKKQWSMSTSRKVQPAFFSVNIVNFSTGQRRLPFSWSKQHFSWPIIVLFKILFSSINIVYIEKLCYFLIYLATFFIVQLVMKSAVEGAHCTFLGRCQPDCSFLPGRHRPAAFFYWRISTGSSFLSGRCPFYSPFHYARNRL